MSFDNMKFKTQFVFTVMLVFCLTNFHYSHADTIDVWMVKLNGKAIIKSNEMEITYWNHPMQIHLSTYNDNDTLQITYGTDCGMERYKWYYFFKNASDSIIGKYENAIDSTGKCFPTPCKTFTDRKNFIPFSVLYLRQLLKRNDISKIFIAFEYDNKKWGGSYLNKSVCVISLD